MLIMTQKIITKKEAKALGLKRYFTGVPCKKGHVSERSISGHCCECRKHTWSAYYDENKDRLLDYSSNWYEANKSKIRDRLDANSDEIKRKSKEYNKRPDVIARKSKYNKEYWQKHKDDPRTREMQRLRDRKYKENNRDKINENNRKPERIEKQKEWRRNNSEYLSIKNKEWRRNNPDLVAKSCKRRSAKNSERYRNDNGYRCLVSMRSHLYRILKLTKQDKIESTSETLGYSVEKFMQRIEFQFKDGMRWDNHGDWHLDHKKPISAFIKQGVTDPKIINALSNLQPLWALDNLKKGNSY